MRQPSRILNLVTLLLLAGGVMSPLYSEGKEKKDSSGCGSYLIIRGETNLNRFSFSYTGEPPVAGYSPGFHPQNSGPEILIPVKQFEPSNPHMYNDFLKQLKEQTYPYITIRINDPGSAETGDEPGLTIQNVMITLSGVTRHYTIECEKIVCGGKYIIRGTETLKLTDFDISPPEKLNGLIKVKNEITVSFGIMLNFTGENSYAISK